MVVNGDRIRVLAERDPAKLPWGELGVDTCSSARACSPARPRPAHLKGGAKKVVISAPGGEDVDATIVYGVNHGVLKATLHRDLQCLVHHQLPGAAGQGAARQASASSQGVMTTIHSYTNDQVLTDVYHTDLRRARSATQSMIPTKTGAAAAVGLVLPELKGKLDGFAIRVPTINVSLVDLTFTAERATSVEEINKLMKAAAARRRCKACSPTTRSRWCRSTSTTIRTPRSSTPR